MYPVAKGPEVRISWMAMLARAALRARVPGEGEPGGLGVLPAAVSDRTAMPHSADRHNKTTSRPTQNTLRGSAPPRTAGPVGPAPLSGSTNELARRARSVNNHEVAEAAIG